MSKVLKVVAVVAAVVAIAATAGGAIMGAAAFSATFGTSAATVAAVASAVSTVASLAATALQKKPSAKGSVSQVIIGVTMPIPYGIGRTYTGGMQVYDNSAGENNKYRYQIMVVSAAGPIEEYESFKTDYQTVPLQGDVASGWYAGFMHVQRFRGNRPEIAHTYHEVAMPGWTSAHKMSGYASYRVQMKFDKDAKRFASGVPQLGVVAKMVRVYDPRLDSTYPGGVGPHRWDDESTWWWSENPALHALTYARGRFIEKDAAGTPLTTPIKIVGAGLPKDAIDIPSFVELANINDANGWTAGGVVYEGPDLSKWDNLKRILQAGGAKPVWSGGMLRVIPSAPRPTLFTITANELADGPIDVKAMKPFRDRHNSIVARYRAEDHKWEYVQGDAVTSATYLAEDGELKTREIQFDLVQDKDQNAQLAAYELVNEREFGPITLSVKPLLLAYKVGESGIVDIPEAGLDNQQVVILGRSVDPETGAITLTMESETPAKHAYALGQTGTAPPTPIIHTSEDMDIYVNPEAIALNSQKIADSAVANLTVSVASTSEISISTHQRLYIDKTVTVNGITFTPNPPANPTDKVGVYYDDPERDGAGITYHYEVLPAGNGEFAQMFVSATNPYRHFVSMLTVPAAGVVTGGSGTGEGTGGTGSGVGGSGYRQEVY